MSQHSRLAKGYACLLLSLVVTANGCDSGRGKDERWALYEHDSGGRLLFYFLEPRLVMRFDGIEGDESGWGQTQITVAGDSEGYGSGIVSYQYKHEVANLGRDNVHLRITDRGQKVWSGEDLIAELPREDWTVIALDKDGKSRELKPGEREEIITDATTRGAFSKERNALPLSGK